MITNARKRGTNNIIAGSMQRLAMASISSRIFMDPIAAVNAGAVRLATMMGIRKILS